MRKDDNNHYEIGGFLNQKISTIKWYKMHFFLNIYLLDQISNDSYDDHIY